MGASLSWVAVRGKSRDAILEQLRLVGTGQKEEIPESPIAGAELRDGWFLVVANNFDFAEQQPLAQLSAAGELVTCAVEEHVMVSSASAWRDGRQVWSVLHDSQVARCHLATEGELPPEFPVIRDELLASQEADGGDASDVDFVFDVPVNVARAMTGYRYDGCTGDDGTASFERLEHPGVTAGIMGLLRRRRQDRRST